MFDTESLKIKWFEKFAYRLLRQVDDPSLHWERKSAIGNYGTINAALIKIFSLRLTYQNFEAFGNMIAQVAGKIASPEIRERLSRLEKAGEKESGRPRGEASELISLTVFLLREQVDVCLELKRRGRMSESREWFTSPFSSALAFQGGILETLLGKLGLCGERHPEFLAESHFIDLSSPPEEEDSETETEENEDTEDAESDESPYRTPSSLDDLLLNMGEKGLDDLIFRKKAPVTTEDDEDAWMGWID